MKYLYEMIVLNKNKFKSGRILNEVVKRVNMGCGV